MAPCVDRIWSVRLKRAERSWAEQWRLVRALRREQFDLALSFNGNDRCIILAGLTGARWRVAHAAGREHFWNRWLIPNWVPRQEPDLTVWEQRRQVLAACGFQLDPPRFALQVPEAAMKWSADLVPPGTAHLSPNSANPLKEWLLDHHVVLLRSLWADHPGLRVVASGSPNPRERERLSKLVARVNDSRLQLLPENLTLAQLAAVLTRCRLHLGPDSGVMHLAVALGVPTISFFREQGAYRAWLPTGPLHQVIRVPCYCVDHHAAPCERLGHAECLARLEPEQVVRLARERLAESDPPLTNCSPRPDPPSILPGPIR
jgi:ADP-heptose:LPS heptosyltransferase